MEHNRDAPRPPGQDLHGLRGATLTARFLCGLARRAARGFWGCVVGEGPWAWLLGVGAPVLAAVVWGAFVAPRARFPVPASLRVQIELVLYALAAVGLAAAGQRVAAVVLGVAGLVTSLLNESQERRAGPEHIRRR